MRCFVAIPFPKAIKKQLGELQEPIIGLRWQKLEQVHLTLKFLGDVSGDKVQALQKQFSKIKMPSFSLSLQGLGYFPKGKNPRVLWVGIEEHESLIWLRDKVEQICISEGFEAEKRPFKPHITLGRMKGTSQGDVEKFINQHKKFKVQNVLVDEFVLYESKLHPQGAKHIRLMAFRLKK
jgi:2'-5' RNA ligase